MLRDAMRKLEESEVLKAMREKLNMKELMLKVDEELGRSCQLGWMDWRGKTEKR